MRVPLAVVGGLLAVVLAGCGPVSTPPAGPDTAAPPVNRSVSVPTGLRIPAIGVYKDSLMRLGLNPDRTIEVPPLKDPQIVGWYRAAPVPGDPGPSIVLGHVNGDGKQGVFAKLAQLKAGDSVEIDRSDGQTAVFTVYDTEILKKSVFPTQRVYGNTAGPELRLITCGPGPLETLPNGQRSYINQTVVFAHLDELRATT